MSSVLPEDKKIDAPLIALLRQGVVHTTSLEHYLAIVEDGHIRPNDGSFPNTFPQSANSCCRQAKSISLFDFGSAPDDKLDNEFVRANWSSFFHTSHPTVCLQFGDDAFEADLIRYEDTKEIGPYPFIWPVEVCYPGLLPVAKVKQVFLTDWYGRWHIQTFDRFPTEDDAVAFRDSVWAT